MGQIIQGDALTELRKLSSNSIDALCVDPPSGINFMSKLWDSNKGGRDQWVAWLAEIMRECLRVMKPGASGLIWSLPRTSHWTAWALEDAGFEVRDCLYHLMSGDAKLATFVESLTDEQRNAFAQLVDSQDEQVTSTLAIFGAGFPKSHNISIAIDRYFKAEREFTGISPNARPAHKLGGMAFDKAVGKEEHSTIQLTEPATPEAQKYAGWGTNLKPAVENWLLIRKPLSEKTIAENVLKWGVGGLNITATRVPTNDSLSIGSGKMGYHGADGSNPGQQHIHGRWPSHLLLSHSIFCVPNGTKHVRGHAPGNIPGSAKSSHPVYGDYANCGSGVHYTDTDGMEEVEDWICDESCPVRLLDEQSGIRTSGGKPGKQYIWKKDHGATSPFVSVGMGGRSISDQGGASRYFKQFYYSPKASRKDRTANGTVENNHPTVKPLELIKYLVRLITPVNGIVLDCFAGSGTTALACIAEGFDYLLIEQDEASCDIARARISYAMNEVRS